VERTKKFEDYKCGICSSGMYCGGGCDPTEKMLNDLAEEIEELKKRSDGC